MSLDNAWNMYIFRDGKAVHRGAELMRELAGRLHDFATHVPGSRRESLVDLLLRAGELECAVLDAGSQDGLRFQGITDQIAESLVRGSDLPANLLLSQLQSVVLPDLVSLSPPEGFAYYALHPLNIADLAKATAASQRTFAVIGIRSIGTTLSAVVKAALRSEGRSVERITVRPEGHPYDRAVKLSSVQLEWVRDMSRRGARFVVVDEGPGMSGSSFLSVGDALTDAGVPVSSIRFLGSRAANPDAMTAPNAGERWRKFEFHGVGLSHYLPKGAKHYIGGGIWRGHAFPNEDLWPASWVQMERMKFLSEDRTRLYKFEGFGRFGRAVHERSLRVAEAGFGPAPFEQDKGFGIYPFLPGRHLAAAELDRELLRRIAEYCAWRAQNITAEVVSTPELETMLTFNAEEEFGVELPPDFRLQVVRPVIADGRMLPHKWIANQGRNLKLDSAVHGDDHFFPGPTDIAWDLAGAIVEWEMDNAAATHVLTCYEKAAGESPDKRMPAYLLAYSVFRMAYCKMASAAMRGSFEQQRLESAYRRYRDRAAGFVEQLGLARARYSIAG